MLAWSLLTKSRKCRFRKLTKKLPNNIQYKHLLFVLLIFFMVGHSCAIVRCVQNLSQIPIMFHRTESGAGAEQNLKFLFIASLELSLVHNKNLKWPQWDTQNWFMKKNLKNIDIEERGGLKVASFDRSRFKAFHSEIVYLVWMNHTLTNLSTGHM